jgi:hypothetical protein
LALLSAIDTGIDGHAAISPVDRMGEPAAAVAVPGRAGPLETSAWQYRRSVPVPRAGAYRLDLDLAVLAHARPGLQDLRLIESSNQVPYLLETAMVAKSVEIAPLAVAAPGNPRISRWRLDLPYPRLPLQRLTARSSSPLFDREFVLFEDPSGRGDARGRRVLGRAGWRQTPNEPRTPLDIDIAGVPETRTLWLETDNGDNAPLNLDRVDLAHADSRLLFMADGEGDLFLYYGNPAANAARYDLTLVAGALLAAPKTPIAAGPEEQLRKATWREQFTGDGRGGPLIWGMFATVVLVLLSVVAYLLRLQPPGNASAQAGLEDDRA